MSAAPADAYDDLTTALLPDAPESGRAAVTQGSSLSAGEHRGHPATLPCHLGPPHGIDPTRDPMKSSLGDPMRNRLTTESKAEQIAPTHDSVLLCGERPRSLASRLELCTCHRTYKVPSEGNSSPDYLGRRWSTGIWRANCAPSSASPASPRCCRGGVAAPAPASRGRRAAAWPAAGTRARPGSCGRSRRSR